MFLFSRPKARVFKHKGQFLKLNLSFHTLWFGFRDGPPCYFFTGKKVLGSPFSYEKRKFEKPASLCDAIAQARAPLILIFSYWLATKKLTQKCGYQADGDCKNRLRLSYLTYLTGFLSKFDLHPGLQK